MIPVYLWNITCNFFVLGTVPLYVTNFLIINRSLFAIWYNRMFINQHITTWHMHWTYHTCKTNHNDMEAGHIGTLQQYMDVSYIMFKFISWNLHNTTPNGKRGRETLSGLWAPYLVHKCLMYKYNQCGGAGSAGCNIDLSHTCICEICWSFTIQWYSNCMYYASRPKVKSSIIHEITSLFY